MLDNPAADPVALDRQATLVGGHALPALIDKALRLAVPAGLETVTRNM
jgi:hypothetical protein